MTFEMLALLVETARAGSLAAAARRLDIAPMVASRRLAALEAHLGVRLMHRTTRSIALTPAGEAFLPHAQAIIEEADRGRASVRPDGEILSGTLRVTASFPFGRKLLTPLIADFMSAHTQLRVELILTDSIIDIVGLGIDLAIRIAHLKDSGLIAHRIGESARSLFASPDYLRRQSVPLTSTELAGHECLLVAGSSHWDVTHPGGARLKVGGRFTASSVEALHQACIEGLGIGLFSKWYVEEDVRQGRLVEISLTDGTITPLSVHAVYPTARQVPPKVRTFIAALSDRFQHGQPGFAATS